MAYGYGLGAPQPVGSVTSALPLPAAGAPAVATPAGGHWQGDLWIADNTQSNGTPGASVTVNSSSSGLPPAPAGYQWSQLNGKPTLVPQTQQVTDASGRTQTVQVAPPLQVDSQGSQFSSDGTILATYDKSGNPIGGQVLGQKSNVVDGNGQTPTLLPGQKVYDSSGGYRTQNDHGTSDYTNSDGNTRAGASAPGTVNADGSITPAAVNAGGDLGHNIARNLDPAGLFDPNGSHIGGVLDPGNVTGWDEKNGGSSGLLGGGSNLVGDQGGTSLIDATGTAVNGIGEGIGDLFGGGSGSGSPAPPLVRDPLNYVYGRDPNYVENTRNRVLTSGTQTQDMLNAIGADARTVAGAHSDAITQQGDATAAGMVPYSTGASDAGAAANDYLLSLEGTEGPSAAQAQLALATQAGIAQQQAQARSGRGFGQSSQANSVAASNAAGITNQAGLQSAMLRAQEYADWKKRQAANAATGGQLNIEGKKVGGSLFATGQAGQAGSYSTAAGVDTAGVRDQGDLVNKGYDATVKGESLADAATKGQADLGVAAEQGNTSTYAADRSKQIADDANKAAHDAAVIGAVGTGFGSVMGAFTPKTSDPRAKTDIRPAEGLADSFADGARGSYYRYLEPEEPGSAPGPQAGPMADKLKSQPATRGAVISRPGQYDKVDPGRLSLVTASALSEVVDRLNHLESRGYRFGGAQ